MAKRKVAPYKAASRARQGEAGPAGTPAHEREHAPEAALSQGTQGTKETIAVTVRLDAERYRKLVRYGAQFVPRRTNQEILIAALDAFLAQVE